MTSVINNLIEINGPFGSKDYYEKNRINKEKYFKKVINPNNPNDKGFTQKQKLSACRQNKKCEQKNNNQFHNRVSKIKEKMSYQDEETDLVYDLEKEYRIDLLIKDEIAAEELYKVRLELVETWIQELIKKSKEDDRYEASYSESDVLYFMEKHDVDPAQIQCAEESLQLLIAQSKRYENIDEDWINDYDSDSSNEDWRLVCWH